MRDARRHAVNLTTEDQVTALRVDTRVDLVSDTKEYCRIYPDTGSPLDGSHLRHSTLSISRCGLHGKDIRDVQHGLKGAVV
jgi:hypothetical protein